MRKRRGLWLSVVGAVLFFLGLVLATQGASLYRRCFARPRLHLPRKRLDFRDLRVGTESFMALDLINSGSAPLIISRIETGCGCTSARIEPTNVVQPGEVSKLFVSVTLSQLEQRDRTTDVAVWTNDPQHEVTVIEIGIHPTKQRPLHSDAIDFGVLCAAWFRT